MVRLYQNEEQDKVLYSEKNLKLQWEVNLKWEKS